MDLLPSAKPRLTFPHRAWRENQQLKVLLFGFNLAAVLPYVSHRIENHVKQLRWTSAAENISHELAAKQ